jgi:DNA polymerase-3 subunit beta
MRATLERAHLLKTLSHVHRVVERRNTIPILSNVLVQASGGEVRLKATDLDLEITETTPAMIEQGGATTVPAHLLHDIVRKLPDGAQVSLETAPDGATLSIRSGRSRFSLQMLPESDFPDITAGPFTHRFEMKAADLRRLIDRTQFAISTEETRYYLNGIYLHALDTRAGATLRAVATDGHRLAQADFAAPEGSAGMPGVIVPRKTVGEIKNLLDDAEAVATVELSESKLRVSIGSVVLTSKLIDGTFPDYARVIPQGNDKELAVERDDFKTAVDRVSTVSSERGRAVKLSISEGKLVLAVNNPDSGSASEELGADYEDEALEIGFNARYLLDIADQIGSGTMRFRLADPGSPTLIQDGSDESALFVLMPMRV